MKKIFTIVTCLITLVGVAQTFTSVYNAPSSGNKMNRFEHDPNYLYAVRDSSVDKIDAVTNVVTKLFDKPWGASLNASGKAIFSNGKAIIGQLITTTGYPYRYKYWVYDGTTFDTLFSIVNSQIDNGWAIDGNVCYFSTNKKVYKSDFTKAGTTVISNFASNTLAINMLVFNHDLYFFNTTSSVDHSVLKKYSGNTLTTIDSSLAGVSDFKMQIYNNELFYSLYEGSGAPKSYIKKINGAGITTTLYADNSSNPVHNMGFMGGVGNQLFMYGTNLLSSTAITEFLYSINTTAGTPTKMQSSSGSFINMQSAETFKQGSSIVYFDVYTNFATNSDRELWQSDGTAAGTHSVIPSATANITHGTGFGLTNLEQWFLQGTNCGDLLYGIMNFGQLWLEDIAANAVNVSPSNYDSFINLTQSGKSIFVQTRNQTNYKAEILKINCSAISGIKENLFATNFLIYPNPSKNELNVLLENSQTTTKLIITDFLGKVVLRENISTKSTTLKIDNLISGIYFVTIIDYNGNTSTQKIIKE